LGYIVCFWQLTDVCFGSMFINLYELLLKGKPVYTLIFIRICEAMLTALTGSLVKKCHNPPRENYL
jgi:hypothetical protein